MLVNLHVKNLALIEETEVDFSDHLNILTGETGAGKSILIGSIQSALGGKIPKDMIRTGCDSALIELVFQTQSKAVRAKMEELELPFEDGEIIISRRITNQRVINKVNGCSITIAHLKELAPLLMDLSGQHENQLLLRPQNHQKIIDNYQKSQIAPVKERVAGLFCEYQSLKRRYMEQNIGEKERLREMEYLEYEIKEIKNARLVVGEDEELELAYQKIAHARDILEVCGQIHSRCGDDTAGAGGLVGSAIRDLDGIVSLDPELKGISDQLSTIDALLNDFNRDLSDYISSMDFDEQTYNEVESRLDLVNHMKAKYGNSIPQILAYQKECEKKYDGLVHHEEILEEIKAKAVKVKKELDAQCAILHALRRSASLPLADAIRKALLDLNFNEVAFEVEISKLSTYTEDGYDKVCFLISTNRGMTPRPLHEIASGGELSRIMLAIKSILADEDQIETLIFDEIDTGISGRTAQKVSERLALIAERRQVIAITHLPQIAAMADSHYRIEKTSDETSTISSIYPLKEEEAIEELARMLGGAQITDAVLDNAKEMRALAMNVKKGSR